jgi:hypothetical protein
VRAFAGFVVRLVVYALLFGITARVADAFWTGAGLDTSVDLQTLHDTGMRALVVAPPALAIIGFGTLRRVAIFVAAFLIGAALTAPFACARFAGG